MTAFAENDEMLADAYGEIDLINSNEDTIIIHYKHYAPPPTVTNYIINRKRGERDNHCYLVNQYFINIEDALSIQLRYLVLDLCKSHHILQFILVNGGF